MESFQKLKTLPVASVTDITRPAERMIVDLNSSAMTIFVDFEREQPFMLEQSTSLNDAIAIMKREHVRRKLVIDSNEHFRGVVSMGDLVSSKAVKAAQLRGLKHDELTIEHVMIDKEHLHAVPLRELQHARIGDALITMQSFDEEHLLVVDDYGRLRGIVSSTDIARAIQMPVRIEEHGHSVPEMFGVRRA